MSGKTTPMRVDHEDAGDIDRSVMGSCADKSPYRPTSGAFIVRLRDVG